MMECPRCDHCVGYVTAAETAVIGVLAHESKCTKVLDKQNNRYECGAELHNVGATAEIARQV